MASVVVPRCRTHPGFPFTFERVSVARIEESRPR
jgi:hypothetical protein